MHNLQNTKLFIKLICLIIVTLVFFTACNSQKGKGISQHKETFKTFCAELKQSKIVYNPDTTNTGFGVYEPFAEKYFDKTEMLNKMKVDTGYLTANAKFFLVQQFTAVLQNYLKYFSPENLEVIEEAKSKGLYKDWEKNSDKEEADMIKNSLVLVYKSKEREIELMVINFSAKKSKIISLISLGTSMEDAKFIESIFKK